jgi:hypothetical protein
VRDRLWWDIALAIGILAASEVLWLRRHTHWAHALLVNALEGLGLAVAASCGIAALLFLWNVARARDKLLIERLSPGPDAVAADQERVRQLRAWVGMLAAEVADKNASAQRIREAGMYWDPQREDFELIRFAESGGLLATDPRTEPAFRAVGALHREMHRVTLIVNNRWSTDLQFEVLDREFIVHRPAVHEADDLDRLAATIKEAATELTNAMERLNE